MQNKSITRSIFAFLLIIPLVIQCFDIKTFATNEPFFNIFYDQANANKLTKFIDNVNIRQSKLNLFASFYPIYDFVKKVGKDRISVSVVVPPGVEPHDFEPTAKQIIDMQKSNAIFINGAGFESWINRIKNTNIIDLSKGLPVEMIGQVPNPHIWLDPLMVKMQAKIIYNSLISLDPQGKEYYTNNYIKFDNDLEKLNSNIINNLTHCKLHDFIAFHDAFGYFAKRYGLNQHAIEGLMPEADVNPQKITEAIKLAQQLGVNIIFTEDNIDPRLSNTIANEIHGKVLLLSPIEMISDKEQKLNEDYFSKMYQNLENLKMALKCTS